MDRRNKGIGSARRVGARSPLQSENLEKKRRYWAEKLTAGISDEMAKGPEMDLKRLGTLLGMGEPFRVTKNDPPALPYDCHARRYRQRVIGRRASSFQPQADLRFGRLC